MNTQRIHRDLTRAQAQFPNIELKATTAGLVLRFVFQSSAANVYSGKIDLASYPNYLPHITITAPQLRPSTHVYSNNRICVLHPSMWNPGRHDLIFLLTRIAKWLNKYEVYQAKGRWPGAEVSH